MALLTRWVGYKGEILFDLILVLPPNGPGASHHFHGPNGKREAQIG